MKIAKSLADLIAKEVKENKKSILWLSFYDSTKEHGERFLGVILTETLGLTHAIMKIHDLGISPGGEVSAFEMNDQPVKKEHFDMLLTLDDLFRFGYFKDIPDDMIVGNGPIKKI